MVPHTMIFCRMIILKEGLRNSDRAGLVKELGRAGGVPAAVGCLEYLLSQHGPAELGTPVFQAAISICSSNFSYDEGVQIFRQMREGGVRGSLLIYNLLIAGLSQVHPRLEPEPGPALHF